MHATYNINQHRTTELPYYADSSLPIWTYESTLPQMWQENTSISTAKAINTPRNVAVNILPWPPNNWAFETGDTRRSKIHLHSVACLGCSLPPAEKICLLVRALIGITNLVFSPFKKPFFLHIYNQNDPVYHSWPKISSSISSIFPVSSTNLVTKSDPAAWKGLGKWKSRTKSTTKASSLGDLLGCHWATCLLVALSGIS